MILLNLAALIFGGTALFSKIIPLPAIDIVFFRGFFAALFLGVFMFIFKRDWFKMNSSKDIFNVVLAGSLFGIHLATLFLRNSNC